MSRFTFVSAAFGLSLFALAGCSVSPEDDTSEQERLGTASQAMMDPPRGSNHFWAEPFWAQDTQAAYRTMGSIAIDRGEGVLPVLTIDAAYRDEVLQNAIECALGEDQTLEDPVTGNSFPGHWGLARSWTSAPLTSAQRKWVTGCMAQRLNAFGMEVDILLEGRLAAIRTDPVLDADMPWDESTVWGDLFSSAADLNDPEVPPFVLSACHDSDLFDACFSLASPIDHLDKRICDSTPNCGLNVLGPCSAACVASAGYPKCTAADGTVSTETVHVQLKDGSCNP